MKILLTADQYAPAVNGVVTSLLTLKRELEHRGHSVRVLTLSGSLRSWRQGGVWALGSLDAGLIYPGVRLRRPAVGSAVRELIAWGPDIVHSQCEFSTWPLARRIARACGAPLLHTYHTVYEDYTHYFSPSRRWGRWLVRALTRRVAAGADVMIAPTPKIEALLRGYGVTAPIRVLPTGVALAAFARTPPPEQLAALRAALGIPPQNAVLLYVGRLAREKNIDELLALRAALGDAPVTLLLAGDGPERARLEHTAAARGLCAPRVVFAGMVPPARVPAFYRLGDVFVSASSSETQGLTYLEAMAAGLPLVCRADACLTGVLQDGQNGWQYRAPADLADRVRALLRDGALRRAMGARSVELAGGYSARAFGLGAEALYRDCLAQKAAPQPRGRGALRWQRA